LQSFRDALEAVPAGGSFVKTAGAAANVEAAIAEGYKQTDDNLLRLCAEKAIDYSSCTSVTAVVTGDLLSVAHLGDSKIVLGREGPGGVLVGKYLTLDHKPDMPEERARIERVGFLPM
jgi:serine/threonine protein phosphatase PrpC